MTKKKTPVVGVLIVIVLAFASGCLKGETKYVCYNGVVLDDPEWCPNPLRKATTTSTPESSETTTSTTTSSSTTTTPAEKLCENRVQDSGEIGIDCGGVCNRPCTYVTSNCTRAKTREYAVGEDTYIDDVMGLHFRGEAEYCVVNRTVIDADDNKIRESKLFFDEKAGAAADLIEEYDVYGNIVGVVGGYISTSYLDSRGNVLIHDSCIDGKRNQDETKVDCGGRCPPCPVKNATLWISKPDTAWYAGSRRGSINDFDFQLTNTGNANITPTFDVKIYKDGHILKKEKFDVKSSIEEPVAPGDAIIGYGQILWYTYTRAEYTVEVLVRDGWDAKVLDSMSKKVTFPD